MTRRILIPSVRWLRSYRALKVGIAMALVVFAVDAFVFVARAAL